MLDKRIKYFRFFTLVKIFTILFLIVIDWMMRHRDSPPSFLSGMTIEFDAWQLILQYLITIVIPANAIIALLLGYKPGAVTSTFLNNRVLLGILYWVELLFLPFLTYVFIRDFQEYFLPPKETAFSIFFKGLFPVDEKLHTYFKLETIDMGIFCVCSLVFALLFYRVLALRRTELQSGENTI